MDNQDAIKEAIERNVKAVSLRPGIGQGTARAVATVRPGLSCEVVDGTHTITVGMTEKYGGSGSAPNPGALGRAAVASCLGIGLSMWAARLGIPLDRLEVTVEADYDVRGELGVTKDIRPGYLAMRYHIAVQSPAPEAEIRRWLETGTQTSSWLDNLANPVPLSGTIEILPAEVS
ncbi:MAG: OsmC family protein [Gemmatimonadales bacterium]